MSDTKPALTPEIQLHLLRYGKQLFAAQLEERLEIGRRDKHEPLAPCLIPKGSHKKLIAADLDVLPFPRSAAMIERAIHGFLRVTNIHSSTAFDILGYGKLLPGKSSTFKLPVNLCFQEGITLAVHQAEGQVTPESYSLLTGSRKSPRIPSPHVESMSSPKLQGRFAGDMEQSFLGSIIEHKASTAAPDAEKFLEILDSVLRTAQMPANTSEFYRGFAEAVTQLIDMDRAEILLLTENGWERSMERAFVKSSHQEMVGRPPASTLLDRMLLSKSIVIHPDSSEEFGTDSIRELVSAIAAPIFDEEKNVLGALYADRISIMGDGSETVSQIEEDLIEILSVTIAMGLFKAKRESQVTTYRQFFSSKVIEAIHDDPKILDGEDCEVTVLFCDIRGFSRITDRIGPANAMQWMQDTLTALSEQVQILDGVLVNYVGDEMFAMWGAPAQSPDHAFRAATSAMAMMNLAIELSERWKTLIPEGFEFGIGLCTGMVHVGNTGSKQKFQYGPIGRTVNLGSRIQGLTKHWRVQTLMNEETSLRLPKDLRRRRLCQARVLGMEGSIALYELVHENSHVTDELLNEYERALSKYECGEHREAAQAFGDLCKRFPKDGPSLIMLVRSVREVAEPSEPFDPIWIAPSK